MAAAAATTVAPEVAAAVGELAGEIPVVDVALFLNRGDSPEAEAAARAEAVRVADALHNYGILCVRDPRVSQDDNNRCVSRPRPGARGTRGRGAAAALWAGRATAA